MSKPVMRLTPTSSAEERVDDVYDCSTVDLINYGDREGGCQIGYDMGIQMAKLREIAFNLVLELQSYGTVIANDVLLELDVEIETKTFVNYADMCKKDAE